MRELVERGVLVQNEGGGRSTSFRLADKQLEVLLEFINGPNLRKPDDFLNAARDC